jgi:hypothetical protein
VQHPDFISATTILFQNLSRDPKVAELFANLLSAISSDHSVVKVNTN